MEWTPTIKDRQGPIYQRIVTALSDDIASGRLQHGQMLPTHRALARALGVDLTTVTRAYAEARDLGLTEATVGRGTFVRVPSSPVPGRVHAPAIDLSMNLPPQADAADLEVRLARALSDMRGETGLGPYLTYQQPGGSVSDRQTAAAWVQDLVPGVEGERVVVAPGTQSALFALLMMLARPGDVVLTERLSYPGFKAAAAHLGIKLHGVEMDADGIVPAALDRAQRATGSKLVYLMPTMHNPTTATMSPERRRRVADVIKRRGLLLIEDDPYAFLASGIESIAAQVPQRTFLTASVSKCIAPGFRASVVVTPDAETAHRLIGALRATLQMPAPLMTAAAVRWMRDGTASSIVAAVRAEATARQSLVGERLGSRTTFAAHPSGHHIWLSLPASWPAQQFAAHLHGRGLAVVTSEAFVVDGAPPNAIRLALGAARSRAQLARALDILAEALAHPAPGQQVV